MDQKDRIVSRLQQRFAVSPLSGQESCGQVVPAGEKKARAAVAARYAHLEPALRCQIDEMLALEARYHLRCYLTADKFRAGIIIPSAVRENHWPEFLRYSRLFFGEAHGAICTVFANELQVAASHYGKNQTGDDGWYLIPDQVQERLARQNLPTTKKENA